MFHLSFRNVSKNSELLRIENDLAEELGTMEVRFGHTDGLPTQEMRLLGFVGTLVEISPECLREDGLTIAEDQ